MQRKEKENYIQLRKESQTNSLSLNSAIEDREDVEYQVYEIGKTKKMQRMHRWDEANVIRQWPTDKKIGQQMPWWNVDHEIARYDKQDNSLVTC